MRKLDIVHELDRTEQFIRGYLESTGLTRLVIGLSGGIDSALSAALATRAIGADMVKGVLLPYKTSHPSSSADALELAKSLGIVTKTIDISPMVDAYFDLYASNASPLRKGNFMARIRMNVLYDWSSAHNALVIGTGNRTELLVGYFTQHGDGACAFEPIGHLYKTEVREISAYLGLPKSILDKAPTADLWEGQTDEEEMGISYPDLDEILYQLTELGLDPQASDTLDFPIKTYQKVQRMILRSEFKRNPPATLSRLYKDI